MTANEGRRSNPLKRQHIEAGRKTKPSMPDTSPDLPARICIADPGSVLPRIPGETVAMWGVRALRAKGLLVAARTSIGPDSERIRELEAALPGPDDIVVSREALRTALVEDAAVTSQGAFSSRLRLLKARDALLAALSQPQPAQEQTRHLNQTSDLVDPRRSGGHLEEM